MNTVWGIQVTLTTGATRWLAKSWNTDVKEVARRVDDFMAKRGDFSDDWLDTSEPSMIARAHIVEFATAPLPPQAER